MHNAEHQAAMLTADRVIFTKRKFQAAYWKRFALTAVGGNRITSNEMEYDGNDYARNLACEKVVLTDAKQTISTDVCLLMTE